MRKSDITKIIDLIIFIIPGASALNAMFKSLKSGGKLVQLMSGAWGRKFLLIAEKTVSKIGLKKMIAKRIVSLINGIGLI